MSSTAPMFHYDSRVQSFQPAPSSSKTKSKAKAVKPAFPLIAASHPKLTPENLARAGFFHNPGEDEDSYDTCQCFLCGVRLGGWDKDDDPFEEHVQRGKCAWAEFVCGPVVHRAQKTKAVYLDPESLPSSAESSDFRALTYGKAWPHKQRSGWLPTVKNLSKAGFVLNATTEFQDMVLCPFCDYGVDGWEATDDPWSIHFTKSPKCPFFVAQIEGTAQIDNAPPKKARRATKAGGARGKRAMTVMSEAQSQAPAELPDPTTQEAESQPVKRTRKPRQTTRGKGKKKEEEEDGEGDNDVAATQSEADQPTETDDLAEIVVGEKKATKARTGRPTRSKAKGKKKDMAEEEESQADPDPVDMISVAEEDPEAVEVVAALKKTRAVKGRKTTTKNKEEEAESQMQLGSEAEVEVEEVQPKSKKGVKAANKTRTTTTAIAAKGKPGRRTKTTSKPNQDTPTDIEDIPNESGVEDQEPSASEVEESQLTSERSQSAPKTKTKSSKAASSTRTKPASKPLPPIPADTTPQPPKQTSSQLDRFANVPPSSPFPSFPTRSTAARITPPDVPQILDTTPRARATLVSNKPARASPHANLPRDVLDKSVAQGALEARRVMEDLLVNPINPTTAEGDKVEAENGVLTDEQKKMTLEDFVRNEMKKRYEVMERQGKDMIGKWEEQTRQARRRIEGL